MGLNDLHHPSQRLGTVTRMEQTMTSMSLRGAYRPRSPRCGPEKAPGWPGSSLSGITHDKLGCRVPAGRAGVTYLAACLLAREKSPERAERLLRQADPLMPKAEAADLHKSFTAQALSCAEAEAAEKEDEEVSDQAAIDSATDLSEVSTEQLVAEIRSRGVTAGE
jgi:hypothetical protein